MESVMALGDDDSSRVDVDGKVYGIVQAAGLRRVRTRPARAPPRMDRASRMTASGGDDDEGVAGAELGRGDEVEDGREFGVAGGGVGELGG